MLKQYCLHVSVTEPAPFADSELHINVHNPGISISNGPHITMTGCNQGVDSDRGSKNEPSVQDHAGSTNMKGLVS